MTMLVGQGGKVLLQAGYFVIVARYLGVAGFGAFAGVVAVVALAAPITSLGALSLMIRNIVQDRARAAAQYATTLALTFGSGVFVTVVLLVIRELIAPAEVTVLVLLSICIADLFGSRFAEAAGGIYWAFETMRKTAAYQLTIQASRAVGAVGLAVAPIEFNLTNWSLTYLAATLIPALVVAALAARDVGLARPDWAGFREDWRQGLLFSFSLSSQSVYNDIDKAMLAKLATLEATGLYTAAYRVVDMAFIPMRALIAAAHPRFFREGALGIAQSARLARRLLAPGAGYCLLVGAGLALFADAVPLILGSDYEDAVPALRALALIPLLKLLHYLPSDALTGAGLQGARSVAQASVAVLNVVLNLVFIPLYGYWGAVFASLIADAALGVAVWTILLLQLRKGRSVKVAGTC